jgi:hypothetical protein
MRTSFGQFRAKMRGAQREAVTLVVYGWRDSEPGTLAWVFPSVRAALRAVRALRNAIGWLIVRGKRAVEGDVDVAALRRAGAVLVEHMA